MNNYDYNELKSELQRIKEKRAVRQYKGACSEAIKLLEKLIPEFNGLDLKTHIAKFIDEKTGIDVYKTVTLHGRKYVEVRHIFYYLCYTFIPDITFTAIGQTFHQTHSNVMESIKKINNYFDNEPFKIKVKQLVKDFNLEYFNGNFKFQQK